MRHSGRKFGLCSIRTIGFFPGSDEFHSTAKGIGDVFGNARHPRLSRPWQRKCTEPNPSLLAIPPQQSELPVHGLTGTVLFYNL